MTDPRAGERLLPHPVTGQLFASPVPPGTGWPADPAAPITPVAHSADDVAALASGSSLEPQAARVRVSAAVPARTLTQEVVLDRFTL